MDGTLVNSEPLKGKALAQACLAYDAEVDYHIYQEVMGEDWPTVTQHFFNKAKIAPEINTFNHAFRSHYQKLLQSELELTLGARSYLSQLKQEGCQLGVVSSAANWMLKQILTQLELDAFFDIIICQEDVNQHKPHPEAYLVALEKLGVKAKDTLVFEDSHAGICAAKEAGCDVVAIKHKFNGSNTLDGALKSICCFSEMG